MRRRVVVWTVLAVLIAPMLALPTAVEAQTPNTNRLVVPIAGTVDGVVGTVTKLTGSLAISRFGVQNGALIAVGALTATVTDEAGNNLRTIVQPIAISVVNVVGSCQILHLELGALDLDVLGLLVHLNTVVLDITPPSGANSVIGTLLCQIAGQVSAGPQAQLAGLLNRLLGLLAGV